MDCGSDAEARFIYTDTGGQPLWMRWEVENQRARGHAGHKVIAACLEEACRLQNLSEVHSKDPCQGARQLIGLDSSTATWGNFVSHGNVTGSHTSRMKTALGTAGSIVVNKVKLGMYREVVVVE